MHVSKFCVMLTLFAAGLLASAAMADPPECTRHCQGSACQPPCTCPVSDEPECPYDGCCEECPESCDQPCDFRCCEEDCCEAECCPCPPECRGLCPPCPPAAYLPAAIRRALGYASSKNQTVRPAGCSKLGCCTGKGCKATKAACKAGCGCNCGCAKCTCGKAFKIACKAGCACNCGCDKCTCGKANKVAKACPYAHVLVGKLRRGNCPFGHGAIGPPAAILHKMAKLIAENAALHAKLEMMTKHTKQQREMEHALMNAKQQIAHLHAKHQHAVTPQEQVMAQMIQMNAEQTARKDEVLVELLSTLVRMQAENGSHGGAVENVIEKFEVKIEKLERSLERVHRENAQLRARMAELVKARRNVQYRTKANRVNRYKCGETSDVDVDVETIRRALNRPASSPRQDVRKDGECTRCPAAPSRR